jgi:integrase
VPVLGRKRAQDVVPSDLSRLYGDLRDRGLSGTTIRLLHAMLSGVLRRAVRRRELAQNPAALADVPTAATPETATWSLEEVQQFLGHELVRDHELYPLWRLIAATGLRRGEALALRRDDLDLEAGVIHVRQNLTAVGGELRFGPPKTKRSRRDVTVGADTVEMLRAHSASQRELASAMGWQSDLMFADQHGRPRHPSSISSAFAWLVGKTGARRVSLHSLRHAHASLLLERGVPIVNVASRLGDSVTTALSVYGHDRAGGQDHAAQLESLLDGTAPPTLSVVACAEDNSEDVLTEGGEPARRPVSAP